MRDGQESQIPTPLGVREPHPPSNMFHFNDNVEVRRAEAPDSHPTLGQESTSSSSTCNVSDHPLVQQAQQQPLTTPTTATKAEQHPGSSMQCFPTEARLRQKQRLKDMKEMGQRPIGRRQHVEDHHDDCGSSLQSLTRFLPEPQQPDPTHAALHAHAADLPLTWLQGCSGGSDLKQQAEACYIAPNVVAAFSTLNSLPPGTSEVLELSGGINDTANFSVRRIFHSGHMFDLTTQACVTDRLDLQVMATYVRECKPAFLVLTPSSAPSMECQTFMEFCGYVAKRQSEDGRHFLAEQMCDISPEAWQKMSTDFATQWHQVHLCDERPYRRLMANHGALLVYAPIFIGANDSNACWPADMKRAINDGLCRAQAATTLSTFRPSQSKTLKVRLYPSVGSGPGDCDTAAEVPRSESEPWRLCPGCRGRQARYDPRHSRVRGQCKFPDDEPHVFECPGCKAHRPIDHPTHTRGPDCRLPLIEERLGARRSGQHPRQPARRASASVAQDRQAQLPDGSDLGAVEEAAAAEREPEVPEPREGDAPSSSSAPVVGADADAEVRAPPDPANGSDGDARVRAPREERRPHDAQVGTPHASDWSRFDIGRSLRVLRVGNDRAVTTELRKLHLRFWHASREAMTQILKHAGVSNRVIELVPQIIQTCVECRKWQRPGPATQHAMTASLKFNQHVECDLLFYRQFITFHCICRATRWRAATVVSAKEGEILFEAFTTCWVGQFGPPEILYMDGESGMWRPDIADRIRRLGCDFKLRAPQQHARYIERRGAVLRAQLHTMEEQLEREGIVYTFPALLAEAVFAGNSLTHVGGSTPYQAVYGRQPWMLPPLETPDLGNRDEMSSEGDRQRELIRQTALSAMISATAASRLNRAAHTRTGQDSREFKPDDLCDVFRKPVSKDASGWVGPYRVVRSEPGQVVVRVKGFDRTYRSQDVRHALLCLMAEQQTSSWHECMQILEEALNQMLPGQSALYGFATNKKGERSLSEQARRRPYVLQALDHLVLNCWRLEEVMSVRLARGAKTLAAVPNASHSTVFWWFNNADSDVMFGVVDHSKVDLAELIGADYRFAKVVQAIHCTGHDITLADACEGTEDLTHESLCGDLLPESDAEAEPNINTPAGTLSTIAEEDEEWQSYAAGLMLNAEESAAVREVFFNHEMLEASKESNNSCDLFHVHPAPEIVEPSYNPISHYLSSGVEPDMYGRPNQADEAGNSCVELWFAREFSNVVGDKDELGPDETRVMQIFASGFRNTVIKRESDLLTPAEMKTCQAEIQAAILEELKIWHRYGCFKRVPKAGASNIMDSRFVAKWKKIEDESNQPKKIVRMRLALRGFKDIQADELEAFAATASRQSQRILCSELACRPHWKFVSLDVNKAFLQGMTYKEIHDLTGEAEREVHFTLPPEAAAHLRKLEGYHDFDERREVLKCVKPGTGCKDAPRAFSLKLAKCTRSSKVQLKPSMFDSELELKHVNEELVLMVAKHVDDLKVAGDPREVDNLIQQLQVEFGKLTLHEDVFTNCGLRHTRLSDGSVQLDQDEYIEAMKPIRHPELTGRESNAACTQEVHGMFQSLLGAVAYALLSQSWASVFVIALQRRTSNPQNIHVRRLNMLLAAMQRLKAKVKFPSMKCCRKLLIFSDASFDKESESKGYGMRGSVYLRLGLKDGRDVCHLIDAQSQSLKLVTRSTFASETLAAVGTTDGLTPLMYTLEEMIRGVVDPSRARQLREQGGFTFDNELCVDAMNLYCALSAQYPKMPAEKTLYTHIAWVRDLLKAGIVRAVSWVDTRDMLADALTKGKIDRQAILSAMSGLWKLEFDRKTYRPSKP